MGAMGELSLWGLQPPSLRGREGYRVPFRESLAGLCLACPTSTAGEHGQAGGGDCRARCWGLGGLGQPPVPSSPLLAVGAGGSKGREERGTEQGAALAKISQPSQKKTKQAAAKDKRNQRAGLQAAVPSVPFRKQPPRNPNPCWCRSCVLQVESPFSSVPREARYNGRNASQLVSVSRQPGSPGDRRPNSVTAPAHSIPEAPLAAGGWPRVWSLFRDSNKWQPDVLQGLLTPKNAVLSFLPR